MTTIKVLVGGEFTGTIRDAFIRHGFDAMSCDFKPSLSPGPHYVGDWTDIQDDGFDLAIFHRTCTNLAYSSAKHLYVDGKKGNGLEEKRWLNLGRDAWSFWHHRETCPIPFVAWENPVMLRYAQIMIGKPDQTVHPWWFGTDENGPDNIKKRTCWWLKGLPPLVKTGNLDGSTARDEIHKSPQLADPEKRRMKRSEMAPGMADAIAQQWGSYVRDNGILNL